jgi:hypothetical protein
LTPAPASAIAHGESVAERSANVAATHAYLLATNSYVEAQLASQPQDLAATEAAAAKIAGECPGVLTNAPPHEEVSEFGLGRVRVPSQPGPSAREEGERNRQSRQLSDLKTELRLALEGSRAQSDREATAALVAVLTSLRWSNPEITFFVHIEAETVQEELDLPAPPVCADMQAWVASGYKTLSAASREAASRTEALLKRAFELIAIGTQTSIQSLPKSLARYENATDRALVRHTKALSERLQAGNHGQASLLARLQTTVGLPASKVEKITRPTRKPKPVVVARGRTAAGGRFVARVQTTSHTLGRGACISVSISEPSRPSEGLLSILSGEGTSRCLSRSHIRPEPAVHCNSGLLTVEASLLPAARSVRLSLSNGDTITTPAILVPARLGGPAGLYYQVVRGPSPIPLSLTELDAQGRTLTTLKLPALVECTKHPVKYVRGGIVQLVHESPPQTPSFTIRAERYRKFGVAHFELKLRASNEETLFGGGGDSFESDFANPEESQPLPAGTGRAIVPHGNPVFEPSASSGCLPQPYVILYGILKAPRDTVLARVSGTLVELPKVAIPARLHAGGVLVYGALSPLPTELLVRGPSGRTIATRDLAEAAKSSTETCEGEAE